MKTMSFKERDALSNETIINIMSSEHKHFQVLRFLNSLKNKVFSRTGHEDQKGSKAIALPSP
jgi:hypothetical protein